MRCCQSTKLPKIWLMSDPRFGARLYPSIQKLPIGSGVIMRHYDDPNHTEIFDQIASLCRRRGHLLLYAGKEHPKAQGIYWSKPPKQQQKHHCKARNGLNNISVHNAAEMQRALLFAPDLILLSPIFATRSHVGDRAIGPSGLLRLSQISNIPIAALGGMNKKRSAMLRYTHGFAAIDGLMD